MLLPAAVLPIAKLGVVMHKPETPHWVISKFAENPLEFVAPAGECVTCWRDFIGWDSSSTQTFWPWRGAC